VIGDFPIVVIYNSVFDVKQCDIEHNASLANCGLQALVCKLRTYVLVKS